MVLIQEKGRLQTRVAMQGFTTNGMEYNKQALPGETAYSPSAGTPNRTCYSKFSVTYTPV